MDSVRKSIRIPADVDNIIEQYRVQHKLKFYSDALFEIIRQHNQLPATSAANTLSAILAADIAKRLKEEMNSDAVAIRLSARSADYNTQVLVRAVNQILSTVRIVQYMDNDTAIMQQCKAITQNEIERYRQLRVSQSQRKHSPAPPEKTESDFQFSTSQPVEPPDDPDIPPDGDLIF